MATGCDTMVELGAALNCVMTAECGAAAPTFGVAAAACGVETAACAVAAGCVTTTGCARTACCKLFSNSRKPDVVAVVTLDMAPIEAGIIAPATFEVAPK